jgi:hypothetical protein
MIFETSTEYLINLSEQDNIIFSAFFLPIRIEFYESFAEWKCEFIKDNYNFHLF